MPDPVSGVPLSPEALEAAANAAMLWPPNRAPVHRERQAWDQGFAAAIAATTTELRAMSDEWLTVEAADYIERLVPLWRDER